jgi:hypothetical protein
MLGVARAYGWTVEHVPSVEDAIALAARAHRGQRYPSPEREPYIFGRRPQREPGEQPPAGYLAWECERIARYERALTRLAKPPC